jgi:hypothetical protein
MTVRSTRSSVTFAAPFRLPGFDAPLPAGIYAVDTEEESIEGNVRTVFHRIATTLVVEMIGRVEDRAVDPKDLEAALRQDCEAAAIAPEVLPPKAPMLLCRRPSVGAGFPCGSASAGRAEGHSFSHVQ